MERGTGTPHATSSTESSIPIVGMGYFYVTKEGIRRRDEMAKEMAETSANPPELASVGGAGDEAISQARATGDILKCLLVRCLTSRNVFAHVVPQKGDDEYHYCAKLAVDDIEWRGHTKVIINTDNERSIVALKQRVAKTLKELKSMENVQTESPAAYESQSNGGVGVGVKLVRWLFRTLKLCMDAPINHAMILWLLQHTSTLLNAKSSGSDGLTCWERIEGRMFN